MSNNKEWYNTELSKSKAKLFKTYLNRLRIYSEASEADDLIHFQCLLDNDEAHLVNKYLSKLEEMQYLYEKEVACSKCNRATIIFQDSVLPGWLFREPGWALVNYTYFCPECNKDRLRNLEIDILIEEEK